MKREIIVGIFLVLIIALIFVLNNSKDSECKLDSDCPQINCIKAPCPGYECIDNNCILPNIPDKCIELKGKWLEEYNECERISKESCTKLGGRYENCASACRNDPAYPDIACIEVCVQVCDLS